METSYQRGDTRVSDADRDRAVAELGEAFQAGRLSQEEFSQRTGRALQARTADDLAGLFRDLPRPAPVAPGGDDPRPTRWVPAGRVIIALVIAVIVLGSAFSHRHGAEGFGWLIPVLFLGLVLRRMFRHHR